MDEKEQMESSQVLEENGEVNKKRSTKNISANEHSINSEKTIREINDLNEKDKEIEGSIDVKEDLPCDEKEDLLQGTPSVAEKIEGNLQRSQVVPVEKKSKSIPKQNLKGKRTIPQPFSLATERRMSKGKSSLEQFNPSLSKSLSLRANSPSPLRTVQTQTSLRLERITELRDGTTKSGSTIRSVIRTQTSLKVERSIELRNGGSKATSRDKEHSEKQTEFFNQKKVKGQGKQDEAKKLHSNSNPKHYEQDMDINKLGKSSLFKAAPLPSFYHKRSASLKHVSIERLEEAEVNKMERSSTFKASPLPSFYHKKSPPRKPELIKIPLTRPKSPNLGPRNKSTSELGNSKAEATSKAVSLPISSSAKETIKNLLKGPWRAPERKCKESKNARGSCGDEVEKRVVSSIEKNDMVISS